MEAGQYNINTKATSEWAYEDSYIHKHRSAWHPLKPCKKVRLVCKVCIYTGSYEILNRFLLIFLDITLVCISHCIEQIQQHPKDSVGTLDPLLQLSLSKLERPNRMSRHKTMLWVPVSIIWVITFEYKTMDVTFTLEFTLLLLVQLLTSWTNWLTDDQTSMYMYSSAT